MSYVKNECKNLIDDSDLWGAKSKGLNFNNVDMGIMSKLSITLNTLISCFSAICTKQACKCVWTLVVQPYNMSFHAQILAILHVIQYPKLSNIPKVLILWWL